MIVEVDEDFCFAKACEMIANNQAYKGTDVFELTEMLISIFKEKAEKERISDELIDYNDMIVSIEEVGEQETIDIGVTGDNLFYCNGILTKNSTGLPMTADLMLAVISTEELVQLNQIMFKQLKSRYGDKAQDSRFVVGVDRSKMRLYNVADASSGLIDSDNPVFDNTKSGENDNVKYDSNKFKGFK